MGQNNCQAYLYKMEINGTLTTVKLLYVKWVSMGHKKTTVSNLYKMGINGTKTTVRLIHVKWVSMGHEHNCQANL